MKLSERKAKEVLDFLVHKIDPKSRWFIEEWDDCFILKIETPCIYGLAVSYARESDKTLCCCATRSCRDMLDMLLDKARRTDIMYRMSSKKNKYVMIPYMSSLEQILLDVDLSSIA